MKGPNIVDHYYEPILFVYPSSTKTQMTICWLLRVKVMFFEKRDTPNQGMPCRMPTVRVPCHPGCWLSSQANLTSCKHTVTQQARRPWPFFVARISKVIWLQIWFLKLLYSCGGFLPKTHAFWYLPHFSLHMKSRILTWVGWLSCRRANLVSAQLWLRFLHKISSLQILHKSSRGQNMSGKIWHVFLDLGDSETSRCEGMFVKICWIKTH